MRFRAPEGVTALFLAGETIEPGEFGLFDAAREWLDDLAAHGCVAVGDGELEALPAVSKAARPRARAEKAS